jgi:hypothetical protein
MYDPTEASNVLSHKGNVMSYESNESQEKRDQVTSVRFTRGENLRLELAAKGCGKTKSELMREAALGIRTRQSRNPMQEELLEIYREALAVCTEATRIIVKEGPNLPFAVSDEINLIRTAAQNLQQLAVSAHKKKVAQ